MTLSVVIPLFNRQDHIGETLASLARQTRLPDQVIVVDDASTDGGAARAEAGLRRLELAGVPDTGLLRLPQNGGPSIARNLGLDWARGEILAFLDADDCWRQDCCAAILHAMKGHDLDLLVLGFQSAPAGERFPDLAALRGETAALDGTLHRLPRVTASAGNPNFFMGRASNVAARRQAIGGERFAEGHHLNENIDFWYRVAQGVARRTGQPAAAALLAEAMIQYRILPDSLSHRRHADWRALAVPPSLERFQRSDEADDERLCAVVGKRWLDFALESLEKDDQRAAFLAAHGALLARFGIGIPQMQAGAA